MTFLIFLSIYLIVGGIWGGIVSALGTTWHVLDDEGVALFTGIIAGFFWPISVPLILFVMIISFSGGWLTRLLNKG